MIKILKIKNEKMSYLDIQDYNLSIEDKKPHYLFLRHDAYKLSLINSNGKEHTVKIGGEILKLNTKQLLAILIKVYNRRFINKFDNVEGEDSQNIFEFLYDALKGYSSDREWTILFHNDAESILEKIFQSGYKDLIKSHIEGLMEKYSKKSNEKYYDEIRKNVYWEIYKLLNTRTDIGIQFTLNSKEFSGIVKLLLMDYVYETICNPDSEYDGTTVRTNHKNTERMEIMLNVLNSIGKFEIDYSKFNEVTRAFIQGFNRFGLPLYIANNIMEEKYTKNHISNNIGFNYVETLWERRYAVVQKLKEFITFHNGVECFPYGESMIPSQQAGMVPSSLNQGCPESAISASPTDVNYTYNPQVNQLQVTGLSIDYGNMSTILFRDLMMKFTEIKERWGAIKNSNPSDEVKENMIYDLKSLYNQIQDARYRLRSSDTDTVDMESVETNLFSLMDDINNCKSESEVALSESFGYSEELKTPEFIKKAINAPVEGVKKVGSAINDGIESGIDYGVDSVKSGINKVGSSIKDSIKSSAKQVGGKVKDIKDDIHFNLHEKKEKIKDGAKNAGNAIAGTTFRALRSVPILSDIADLHDNVKGKMAMREKRKKEWLEQKEAKKNGYSLGETARLLGYTADDIFKYTKLNTYGESITGTLKEKVSYALLGELYNGLESAKKINPNLKGLFSMGEFNNCIEELDNISLISENAPLIDIASKLKTSLKEMEYSPKSVAEKKEFFSGFENYSEFNKRQVIITAFESLNETLDKLDGKGRKAVLCAMSEKFNDYLSNKQKEIISNRLYEADELIKKG